VIGGPALVNFLFRVRYGFRGAPVNLLGRTFRLDESLRRWRTEGEEAVMRSICENLRPGDVFVDVGANFGLHTLLGASCVGESGQVVAIEPVPGNHRLLRRNLELNGLARRVSVITKAASDVGGGRVTLHGVTDGVSVAASLRPHEGPESDVVVDATTLDDCLTDLARPVRLIKIDVEGAEHWVIRGAGRILRDHRPLLLVEVHEFALADFDTSVEQFRNDLQRLGYDEQVIDVIEGPEGRYYHALYRPRS